MDARSGKPNTQHVLLCGDVVGGRNPLQVVKVAEREKRKRYIVKPLPLFALHEASAV